MNLLFDRINPISTTIRVANIKKLYWKIYPATKQLYIILYPHLISVFDYTITIANSLNACNYTHKFKWIIKMIIGFVLKKKTINTCLTATNSEHTSFEFFSLKIKIIENKYSKSSSIFFFPNILDAKIYTKTF